MLPNQLPVVEWTTDGVKFKTTLLDAVSGRKLALRVVQAMAPALKNISSVDLKDGTALMASMFAEVLGNLSPDLYDELCQNFFDTTVMPRAGGEDSLKGETAGAYYFAGKYDLLMRCVWEWCKANGFLGFLERLQKLVQEALEKAKSPSKSPTT